MADPVLAAPLAYMGDDGTFALEIRRCSDFALVATVEPGEERYGRILADVVETARRLEDVTAAAEALLAAPPGGAQLEAKEVLRAAIDRARGVTQ